MRYFLLASLLSCVEPQEPEMYVPCPAVWPAGRDMVDPRTGEKGVFLTQDEWQLLWDCEAERRAR